MPFFRGPVEAYDEMMSELGGEEAPPEWKGGRPSEEFEFEAATGRFAREQLNPLTQILLDGLLSIGVTHFRVRYDGGYDEGFAYPEAFSLGENIQTISDVLSEVATPQFRDAIQQAVRGDRMRASEWYASASPVELATATLDELAGELAVQLLEEGFGTGEYEMCGAFTADLRSGELVDDPDAQKSEPGE